MNTDQRFGIGLFLLVLLLLPACAKRNTGIKDIPITNNEILHPEQASSKAIEAKSTEDVGYSEEKKSLVDGLQSESTADGQTVLNEEPGEIEEHNNLWDRLFSLYALPEINNPKIDRQLQWFVANPDYLQRVQERGAPYLYDIVEQLEKNGIPGEIALLPIVESAFRPYAYSSGRAAGIWQFIPGTGRIYGLRQNWWYDGRRDVYASTRAAMRYLKKLQRDFKGDWLLALAAYNSGEGKIKRAIKRNRRNGKPTDFWHLKIPRETRAYVPRLLAIAKVFRDAERYGIKLRDIADKPVFQAVDIGGQLDLAVAAKMAEMEIEELYRFNPGFNRWATTPKGPHLLVVPIEKSELFKNNLAELDPKDRIQWTRHKIRKGQTLIHIARKYGTTASVLRQVNQMRSHTIYAGKNLMVPLSKLDPSSYHRTRFGRHFRALPPSNGKKITYTVRSGDSLWGIASKHAVSMKKLAQWNNMRTWDVIRPGQKLKVWRAPSQYQQSLANSAMNPFRTIKYTVRKGDSLYLISRRFNVKVADLRRWNASRLGKYLKPGQKLKVQVDITRPAT